MQSVLISTNVVNSNHIQALLPRYSRNIFESDAKHQNITPIKPYFAYG